MRNTLHRLLLSCILLACASGALCLASVPSLAAGQNTAEKKSDTPPGQERFRVHFKNPNYDFELLRNMGAAWNGAADIVECLKTADRIKEGDGESWYAQWLALAETVESWGSTSLQAGDKVSARQAFLRASNYYRTCNFFIHGDPKDPRIKNSWAKSKKMFLQAAKLSEEYIEPVRIPYADTTLPGYVCCPDDSGKARKTLILQTGFDGTGEELYYSYGLPALRRGYTVLIFEGPGQGGALIEQGLTFTPQWEKVVSAVVDFAFKRKECDNEKLALMGISMGGYLAPHAAAYEHRLAALIANPGAFDLRGKGFPSTKDLAEMEADKNDSNKGLRAAMDKNPGFGWFINNGMFTTGTKTPLDFINFWNQFTLKGIVDKITTPTLVIVGGNDIFYDIPTQKVLYDKLSCPKTLLEFPCNGYAGAHCQEGALARGAMQIFKWLDATLGSGH